MGSKELFLSFNSKSMQDIRLNKIRQFFKNNRRLPSYSEMLKIFGLRSKNAIHKIVSGWLEKGVLIKTGNKLSPTGQFFSLPLLGQVKAGFPTPAEEDWHFMSLDDYLVEKPTASFLLKVDGDSLIDLGILPGDLVIVERKTEANPEDIVLALIDGDWTLKIFQKKNNQVYLQSANKKYPSFYPEQELKIYGVVKAVTRKIR